MLLLLLVSSQSCLQGLLFHNPVVHKIKIKSFPHKCFSEHRNYLLVVRPFFEFQFPRIIEEVSKFLRLTCCQIIDASNGFLHLNLLIFLFFCLCWQTLPWKTTFDKIHQDHSNLLEVISSCLFYTQMSIQARISCGACKLFVVFVRYMSTSARVLISLCKAKIYKINDVLLFTQSYQKVVGFNISMQEPILVDKFYAL